MSELEDEMSELEDLTEAVKKISIESSIKSFNEGYKLGWRDCELKHEASQPAISRESLTAEIEELRKEIEAKQILLLKL